MTTLRPENGFCVCVAGIPGIGKSTLMKAHVDARGAQDRQLTGSAVIKSIIAPATTREFDAWPESAQTAAREEAILRLQDMRRDTPGRLLIDGHFTLRNCQTGLVTNVFTPGDRAFYDALVLLTSTPERVMALRTADQRQREPETLGQLEEHLQLEARQAYIQAGAMGVPLLVISADGLLERLSELGAFLDWVAALGRPSA